MVERCREAFPVRMMCRCLQVSAAGYYAWRSRPMSARAWDTQRLLGRIQSLHAASDGVLGAFRIWEDLRHSGESCSLNRVARLMHRARLQGVPQRRRWKKKLGKARPLGIGNHLERNFKGECRCRADGLNIRVSKTVPARALICARLRSSSQAGRNPHRRSSQTLWPSRTRITGASCCGAML